jgi:hypothetical protein
MIEAAREGTEIRAQRMPLRQTKHDHQEEATWRERALNAESGLKEARAEIGRQRGTIAELMGTIRDMETAHPDEAAQPHYD